MEDKISGRENQRINDRFAGVLLAAGHSHRMGSPKPMLEFGHATTFLDACLKAFIDFGCEKVVVVTNKHVYDLLKSAIKDLPVNVRFVLNNYPERGRFYSLGCGLKTIQSYTKVFFHNVDNPFISSDVLKALSAQEQTADVICPAYNGKRGHPVLISSKVVSDIVSESNTERNLRNYLDRYHNVSVPVHDPNILININTPEEYTRLLGGSQE